MHGMGKHLHACKTIHSVAVLDLSNWRGSAPVFCGAPKGEGFGEGAMSLKLGGLTLNWGLSPH